MRPVAPRLTPIELDCTTCGYVLRVALAQAGRIVVCPACEARLFVPDALATPVEPSPVVPKPPTFAGLFNRTGVRWAT
jgi:DNA-directed RNA polymerase subunit RPC12/RpoP